VPQPRVKGKFDPLSAGAKKVAKTAAGELPPALIATQTRPLQPALIERMRAFRDFASGLERRAELERLFPDLERALQGLLAEQGLTAKAFGCKTPKELTDRILAWLSNFNITARTRTKFLHDVKGYRSNLGGELSEWLIRNEEWITRMVTQWASAETDSLNGVVRTTAGMTLAQLQKAPKRVVDARGTPVILAPDTTFGPPVRVTTIVTDSPAGKNKKFVDDMFVSFALDKAGKRVLDATGKPFAAVIVMGQFKFNSAIRKGTRQIAEQRGRLNRMSEMRFEAGSEKLALSATQVVFLGGQQPPQLNAFLVGSSDRLVRPAKPMLSPDSTIDDALNNDLVRMTPINRTVMVDDQQVVARGVRVDVDLGSQAVQAITKLIFGR